MKMQANQPAMKNTVCLKQNTKQKEHLMDANWMKRTLKHETEEADGNSEYQIMTRDPLQILLTCMLLVDPGFCKRKLWPYNFGIQNCVRQALLQSAK
jgi:hypothetical protein